MTAPPFAYWHRITFASGTGQGGDGWSNRLEVLWCNRAAAPTLFDLGSAS